MTTKTIVDNLEDLPKWAQMEIKVMQMILNEAKAELLRINENPKSNTILGSPYTHGDEQIKYLRNNQQISFMHDNGYVSARVIENGVIDIHSQGGELFIKPRVSNGFEIHIK